MSGEASQRTRFIIEVIVGLSVVIGALLVAYELNQARKIQRAQIISDHLTLMIQHNIAIMGENAADVWAKGCRSADSLTPAEFEVFIATHNNLRLAAQRLRITEFYADLDFPWQLGAQQPISKYMSTPLGLSTISNQSNK